MTVIYIGSSADSLQAVRAPTSVKETFQDLDAASTTRTASGRMVRSVVRGGDNNVRKLEMEWEIIPENVAHKILDLVKGTFFYMKYPDIQTGEYRTSRFYAGDRAVEFRRLDENGVMVSSLSFNVIER